MATFLQCLRQPLPDLVIAVCTLSCFQLFDALHRHLVCPRLPAYRRLSLRDQYDWDRRLTNITFQILQLPFNLYILFIDRSAAIDSIYGYSRIAHVGFVVILSFYVHDTTGMIVHPRAPSGSFGWIIHHFIAVALLTYNVTYKQSSAFPAAAFLISAAGHIPNDLRWFLIASSVFEHSSIAFRNAFNVVSTVIVASLFLIPPVWLLLRCAHQLNISLYVLLTNIMTAYCNFFFALIYFVHIGVILSLCGRIAEEWHKQPPKFRHSKHE
ncbi:unnamed protein product [Agarophyton chilense]